MDYLIFPWGQLAMTGAEINKAMTRPCAKIAVPVSVASVIVIMALVLI